MDKLVVAVFDDEGKACEGSRILRALGAVGSVEVFATSVIAKDVSGKVDVKGAADERPLGTEVGLLTGGLLGSLGGPVGFAVAAGAGTLGGASYALARVEAKLRATQDRAKAALAAAKEESEAKINVLAD